MAGKENAVGSIAVDTEHTPDRLLTLAVANGQAALEYEPPESFEPALDKLRASEWLVGHSPYGDVDQLAELGVSKLGWVDGTRLIDTTLVARLLDENKGSYALEDLLTESYLVEPWKYKTQALIEKGKVDELPPTDRRERCRLDAWASYVLARDMVPRVPGNLRELATRIACAVHRIGLAGAVVDLAKFKEMGAYVGGEYEQSKLLVTQSANRVGLPDFSPSNDNHIRTYLYDKLGFPVLHKTAAGLPSVDKNSLKELKERIPEGASAEILDLLLGYAKWEKLHAVNVVGLQGLLRQTFVPEVLGHGVGSHDLPDQRAGVLPVGYLGFHINPLGARTGRRSSSDPNSQNWPKYVRRIIRSRFPGGVIADNDYKRLEIFLIGWLAGEWKLIEFFRTGNGYIRIAKELFGTTPAEGTREYVAAKSLVLALGYNAGDGQTADFMWRNMGVRLHTDYREHKREVSRLRGIYLNKLFPNLPVYMDAREQEMLRTGRVINILGQARRLPVPDGKNTPNYKRKLNQAINFPVQSLASYVTGTALVDIEYELARDLGADLLSYHLALLDGQKKYLTADGSRGIIPDYSSVPVNEVHDDIVMDLHPDKIKVHQELTIECMRSLRTLRHYAPRAKELVGLLDVDSKLNSHWAGGD